jgi:hypothetical protein
MSLTRRLEAVETEISKIVDRADAKTKGSTGDNKFNMHWANAQHHGGNLARLIGGPVSIKYSLACPEDAPSAQQHAYYEVQRMAECCGQSYLRALAGIFAGERSQYEEWSVWLAEWADHLDSLNIPDLSVYAISSRMPGSVGRTWQQKLAWALAIGKDNLQAELAKTRWFDSGYSFDMHSSHQATLDYVERQGGFYRSPIPLEAVPPLPEWMTDYMRDFPNPYSCEPYVYSDGTQLECR